MSVFTDCCERKDRQNAELRKAARAVLDRISIFGLPDPHDKSFQMDHHRGELAKALTELAKLAPAEPRETSSETPGVGASQP